jgi:pyruvate/2-oxoglutarate dehydrogenase complex dihydrolipoamide dehydrogenase (E3) component
MAASPTKLAIAPADEHNRRLADNVHPPGWVNPSPASRYNLVVIGAGTAGLVIAAGAAGLGAKVALVERDLMGGDCLNFGCVPSKAIIRASRAAAEIRDAARFGIQVPEGFQINFGAVMERMRRLRADLSRTDSAARFRSLGVDVFLGDAHFTGPDTIVVDDARLRFRRAAIATGARAAELPIPGLKETGYLTNETVFTLTALPRRVAVIGGGPIGCELAQALRRFGAEVAILEVASQILIREDRDAAERVEKALLRDGVDLITRCNIIGLERRGAEKVIRFERPAGTQPTALSASDQSSRRGAEQSVAGSPLAAPPPDSISKPADVRYDQTAGVTAELAPRAAELVVDEILLGVGRTPMVAGLDLEAAGVNYDRVAGVTVDDHLRTTNPKIYAAGDVCSQFKFTHLADAMARIVIRNALFFGRASASALTIPWCTYTDPEIAHVGLYECDAHARGIKVRTFVQEFANVDRAVLDDETAGMVKMLVAEGNDRILGATVVASHASEMITEVTLAIAKGIGLSALADVIHPYPTQAEAFRKLGDQYNRTRLTPRVKHLFERWLSWTR